MKFIRSEFGHEYDSYRFGYCENAVYETGDDVAGLYAQGFLPYSADPTKQGMLYMARSARVRLPDFAYTSENRRIAKRFEGAFTLRILTPEEAQRDGRVIPLFLTYFAQRHGDRVMPEDRLAGIFATPLPLRVLSYERDGTLVAAVLEITTPEARHFWFSAYDLSYMKQSLGMWLMLDAARRAKEDGIVHYYIGTAYGVKALYKTNLEPLEFWDGSFWNGDGAELKRRARAESAREPITAGSLSPTPSQRA